MDERRRPFRRGRVPAWAGVAVLLGTIAVVVAVKPVEAQPAADPCAAWASGRVPPGGRTLWIDGSHPSADDSGPATPDRPWSTPAPLRRRGTLRPGDLVVFRAGTYTAAVRPAVAGAPDAPIVFAACPGQEVVVDGSDALATRWTRMGASWVSGVVEAQGPVGGRHDRHLLVFDGRVLRPAGDDGTPGPGTFRVRDLGRDRVTIELGLDGDADPNAAEVRIGRRGTLFGPPEASEGCPRDPAAGYYRIEGIRFRHAANPAQKGAVCLGGRAVEATGVIVERTNGLGIEMVGSGHILRRSASSDNGQAGIGGQCEACLLEDVRSDRNNFRGHDRFWEAGGGKWTDTRRTVFRRYGASDNDGVGLWFDGDATDNLVEEPDIDGSEVAALMFELGSDRNRVTGGRLAGTRYRAWSGSGVLQQAAGDNELDGVTIRDNEGSGLWVRPDDRRPTGGITVRACLFAGNAADGRDDDFEVRLDADVARGERPPAFVFEANRVVPARPGLALGYASWRGGAPRAADPEAVFGSAAALRTDRVPD